MKFYDVEGIPISKEKFVEIYSGDYFVKIDGKKGIVPNLKRCSKFVEDEIETILQEGISRKPGYGTRDVARILTWKIGRFKSRECDEKSEFLYISKIGKTLKNLMLHFIQNRFHSIKLLTIL